MGSQSHRLGAPRVSDQDHFDSDVPISALPTAVRLRSKLMWAACRGACEFIYHADDTPLIYSDGITAAMAADYTWKIVLKGERLATPVGDNKVWIGGQSGGECVPTSGNGSWMACTVRAGSIAYLFGYIFG